MTLTRNQIHERLGSLSGEIKAAREEKRIRQDELIAAEHAVGLAQAADAKAQAHIDRLEAERVELAQAYASEALKVGEPLAEPEADPFPHWPNHYTNGSEERLNAVFEAATNP